ncbi:polya polymerase [Pseudobutyrivibrio xylanivorans]|uniref:Polya polymerase n=1 Tax=Pseudobutyrivibrio xylanivorans TaxID=185007 RepID=A0A5P6VP61_PSEXY|nr:polya polymerase [Pseudobutyrivibrio xylanivorans]QFJ54455.1 polya polymerase [Pseudobutyrivibrio xylanivorans]
MKITNIKDTEAFFKVIDSCVGTVELVTNEGDRLNLKSKLSQFVSLANIFQADSSIIPELELIAYEPEDSKRLLDFMINQ